MLNIIISVLLNSCFQKKTNFRYWPIHSPKIWTFNIKNQTIKNKWKCIEIRWYIYQNVQILTFGTIWLLSLPLLSEEVDEIRQHVYARSQQTLQRQKSYENWEQNENDIYILNISNFWISNHVDLFSK